MRLINRAAGVIKPRPPFQDWINHTPQRVSAPEPYARGLG